MMMAAVNTFGNADFSRRLAGVPQLFRKSGWVACIVVFLCRVWLLTVFLTPHAARIRRQMLSNIEHP
jgi:hypothetical protein